jgi:hypothetical protein
MRQQSWHDVIMVCISCNNNYSAYWGSDYNLDEVNHSCRCGSLLEGLKIYEHQAN